MIVKTEKNVSVRKESNMSGREVVKGRDDKKKAVVAFKTPTHEYFVDGDTKYLSSHVARYRTTPSIQFAAILSGRRTKEDLGGWGSSVSGHVRG